MYLNDWMAAEINVLRRSDYASELGISPEDLGPEDFQQILWELLEKHHMDGVKPLTERRVVRKLAEIVSRVY